MCPPPPAAADPGPAGSRSPLEERAAELGGALGQREAAHADGLARARATAERLHAQVARALDAFHGAAADAGAPHLRVDLSAVRTDAKHVRSVEFELSRGRHRAVVTAKSRGDLTLVGPFRVGKAEGPCKSFPADSEDEVQRALAGFLESFLEEAATP